jgi:phosphoribosylformylglycinamidine cyclo-ligase
VSEPKDSEPKDSEPKDSESREMVSSTAGARKTTPSVAQGGAYQRAGVNIDAQDEALAEIKGLARSTFTPGVLTEIGSFGGLFRPDLAGLDEPVLVASADGVGTKLMVARLAGDYSSVGADLVNHCVNDILVQGARPLFFMDYVGAGALEPAAVVDLVRGVSRACRENGCALLGGETAEMPGFYAPGDYELVGFIVGLVNRAEIFDGSQVRPGDVLLGLASSGLHTNGYSLARQVIFEQMGLAIGDPIPDGSGRTVAEALLAVHRSYLSRVSPLLQGSGLRAMAHITGGGLTDNLPRILPEGCHAEIDIGSWPVPPLFDLLRRTGEISFAEMLRVFNMGIGFVLVVDPERAEQARSRLEAAGEPSYVLGRVGPGGSGVRYRGLDPAGEG